MARRVQPAGWQAARLIDMGGGLVTAVAPDLLNDNEAQVAEWVDFSQKGTIRPALGRRKRYASPFSTYPVRGIHGYYKKDGTSRLLLYAGGVVYYDKPHFVREFDTQAEWDSGVHNLDSAAVPGDLKLLPAPTSAFARSTVAYNDDGTQVAANTPRYKAGKYANGYWAEESTQNLIKDASFDSATAIGATGSAWATAIVVAAGATGSVAKDSTVYRGASKRSVRMQIGGTTAAGDYAEVRQLNISGTAGQVYTVSGFAKGSASAGAPKGRVYVRFADSSNATLGYGGPAILNLTADWTKFTLTVTAPAGTAYIGPMFRLQAASAGDAGVIYYDDVQLEAKGYATSVIYAADDTIQAIRAADNLSYTLPKPLPVRNAGCLRYRPTYASGRAVTLAWIMNTAATPVWRYEVGHDGSAFVFKKNDGATVYSLATAAVSFAAGDTILLAWLDDPVTGVMKLWYGINGAALTEVSLANTVQISDAQKVYLGCRDAAGYECNGVIDDPQLYSAATIIANGGAVDVNWWNAIYTSTTAQAWGIHTLFHSTLDNTISPDAATQGVWVSPAIDVSTVQDKASGVVTWDTLLPSGTSLQVETRTSADGATWSAWEAVAANGAINSPGNNYVQVRAKLATTDIAAANPALHALHVIFDGSPSVTQLASGFAAAAEAFFETFRDLCIMVNGYDAPQKWDGVNPIASLGGSPPYAQFCAVHQNRLWMACSSSNPSRVWFSDLLDPETWPALNYIDVAPEDGDRITGLFKYKDWLVVTKSRSTWVILGDSIENFALRCVFPTFGSVSMRGLAVLGGQLAVVSADGIRFTDLAAEVVASERIRPTWEALNPRRLSQIVAFVSDHLLYVCGPDGSSITNDTALVYDSIRQCWSTRPGLQVGCACHFVEGGHTKLLLGSSVDGQIYTLDAETDLGNVVPMKWESKAWNFGVPEAVKAVRRLFLNVKSPGSVGQVKVYLRPDLGTLSVPVTLDYPGDGGAHTLMALTSLAGVALARHVSVRVEAVTPASRFELHSIAVEFLPVGVRL